MAPLLSAVDEHRLWPREFILLFQPRHKGVRWGRVTGNMTMKLYGYEMVSGASLDIWEG